MAEKKKITIRPSSLGDKPTSGGKRVISKTTPDVEIVEKVEEKKAEITPEAEVKLKRSCYFCESKKDPSYTDLVILKKYLTDRAKIVAKLRSSVCSRHQRAVARHIKYARHLSLLAFTPKV